MINAFINLEPFRFLASNFEKSTEYCNHASNRSGRSNIDAGQRTHLKLGELSSLIIVYNITIS